MKLLCTEWFASVGICLSGALMPLSAWALPSHLENMMVVDGDPDSDQNQNVEDQLHQQDDQQYEKNRQLAKACRPHFALPGYDYEAFVHQADYNWRLRHPASVARYRLDCQTITNAAREAGCDYGEAICRPADN